MPNDRISELAHAAIDLLHRAGIDATWEYPGFICVRTGCGRRLNYGFDATWYGHAEEANGTLVDDGEIDEIPNYTATAAMIADALTKAHRRFSR